MEEGQWSSTETGTPQGSVASPTLANIYLHYCFDLWAERWRRRSARGQVIYVRYADDIVVGFEHRDEAERFPTAAAVILTQPHPSGVAEPSQADEFITRRPKEALDHVLGGFAVSPPR